MIRMVLHTMEPHQQDHDRHEHYGWLTCNQPVPERRIALEEQAFAGSYVQL